MPDDLRKRRELLVAGLKAVTAIDGAAAHRRFDELADEIDEIDKEIEGLDKEE